TAEPVQQKAGNKQPEQGQPQRMRIKKRRLPDPLLLRLFLVRVTRFRRTALKEPCRQHDIDPHLQKLALPVFKKCGEKLSAYQILQEGQRDLSVFCKLFVVACKACRRHAEDRYAEQDGERNRQSVVSEKRTHSIPPLD